MQQNAPFFMCGNQKFSEEEQSLPQEEKLPRQTLPPSSRISGLNRPPHISKCGYAYSLSEMFELWKQLGEGLMGRQISIQVTEYLCRYLAATRVTGYLVGTSLIDRC